MKKINKLNLISLSERELDKRQMKTLKGGYDWPESLGSCQGDSCNCGSISPSKSSNSYAIDKS